MYLSNNLPSTKYDGLWMKWKKLHNFLVLDVIENGILGHKISYPIDFRNQSKKRIKKKSSILFFPFAFNSKQIFLNWTKTLWGSLSVFQFEWNLLVRRISHFFDPLQVKRNKMDINLFPLLWLCKKETAEKNSQWIQIDNKR